MGGFMKKIFLFVLLCSSFVYADDALQGTIIARYQYAVFFSPQPYNLEISVYDDGTVIKKITQERVTVSTKVAVLLKDSLKSLKKAIQDIPKNAELFDPNPEQPPCMDAPGSTTSVFKDKKEIVTQTTVACKTKFVNEVGAARVNKLLDGLAGLFH